jgi:hypothetical protein
MLETIRKDLLFCRRDLLINAFIIAVTLGILTSLDDMSVRATAVFAGLMAAVFPVVLVTREDKSNAVALACSLPVTRRTIVRARYVLGVALAALGVLLALFIAALLPTSTLPASALFSSSPLLLALSLALLLMSLMLPLTLRLGAVGLIVLLVVLQVIGVVLLTVVQLTGSNADLLLIGMLAEGVGAVREALGGVGFQLLIWLGLGGFLLASYGLAIHLFERREL